MPIFPVTKIPSPPAQGFPEYTILNNEFLPFTQPSGGSILKQLLPVHSLIDEEVANDILALYNSKPDAVQFPMPTNGILSKFRYFQIENNTTLTFDWNFINFTTTTTTTIFSPQAETEELFKNDTQQISVNKGDLVNWELLLPSAPTQFLHIHQLYISFNFKPTSST